MSRTDIWRALDELAIGWGFACGIVAIAWWAERAIGVEQARR